MLVALDYDGTVNHDFDFWLAFIALLKHHGHRVVIATMRYEHETVEKRFADAVERVVYTGHKAKKPHLEALGLKPDVWIDDSPNWLFEDSPT